MSAQVLAVLAKFELFTTKQLVVPSLSQIEFPVPSLVDVVKKPEAIFVQALSTNSDRVFIGSTGVTIDGAGIELNPGSMVMLETRDYSVWYARAQTNGDKLNIIYFAGTV